MIIKALIQYIRHGETALHGEADTTPQAHVDLARFTGRWYEMARYDIPFEKGLENVCADYALCGCGRRLCITNTGTDAKGRVHRMRAGAKLAGKTPTGRLRISYVAPYRWFYRDYRILYVDPEYREALVSGEDSRYLWLMGRSPVLEVERFQRLLNIAQSRGFHTQDLHITSHRPQPALPG